MKAFISQLKEDNPYTTPNPPTRNQINNNKHIMIYCLDAKLCGVCGLKGTLRCSKCKHGFYCSKQHQVIDWDSNHKQTCQSSTNLTSESIAKTFAFGFPEMDIVIEQEPEKKRDASSNSHDYEKSEMEHLVDDMKLDTSNEQAENTDTGVDGMFIKFQKRVEREPQQVIRHLMQPEHVHEPLWVSSIGKPSVKDIGCCRICGEVKDFEVQVMPQMVSHLQIKDTGNKDSIDWGSLMVYTCGKFCWEEGKVYEEAVIWKQDFSGDGMRNPKDNEEQK